MTDAATLTRALGGRWHGRYGSAFCPAHANTEPRRCHWPMGPRGGFSQPVMRAATFPPSWPPCAGGDWWRTAQTPLCPIYPATTRAREERARAEKREMQAARLWRETSPVAGTPAERYLRGRGIAAALPETLRFSQACWHATAQRLPALVALVEGGEGAAVHRTYLRPDGSGKADVQPNKAMLGGVGGGAVRLAEEPGPLVVAEGVETALSLMSGLLRRPAAVWAALSTSGMKGLALPPQPGRLIVASDGDAPGRDAAHALAARADALGWRVSLLPAPEGRDWSDILAMKGRAA